MEMIKKLEEEDNQLLKAEDRRRKQQEEETICAICLSGLYDETWIPLENCSHMFHKACFCDHLKSGVELN